MTTSIDVEATLVTGSEPGAWTYAIVHGSAAVFGTPGPSGLPARSTRNPWR